MHRDIACMHRYLASFLITLLFFVVLDFAWTRLLLGRFYRKPSGPLMLEHFQPVQTKIKIIRRAYEPN